MSTLFRNLSLVSGLSKESPTPGLEQASSSNSTGETETAGQRDGTTNDLAVENPLPEAQQSVRPKLFSQNSARKDAGDEEPEKLESSESEGSDEPSIFYNVEAIDMTSPVPRKRFECRESESIPRISTLPTQDPLL